MGNQTLCAGERVQTSQQLQDEMRLRKVTQVQGLVRLDDEKIDKQSMIITQQDQQVKCSSLDDWLESLHESVLISQMNQKSGASTEFISMIDEVDDVEQSKISIVNSQDLGEYRGNYPYCSSNLDMVIINFYILKKQEFRVKLIQGPPKQRIRWSCWQLMAYTPKFRLFIDNLSCLEGNEVYTFAIKKDTHRTVTAKNIKYFENGEGKEDLEKVLVKLSKLFPKLGYCQGMNFLVGFTLIINNKQVDSSLQFLAQMMVNPKFLLYYIYSDQMPLVKLLEFMCEEELKNKLPELYQQIYVKMEVKNAFWLTKVIMTLFLYNFHLHAVCRFWDFMLATSIFQISAILCSIIYTFGNLIIEMEELNDYIMWFDKLQEQEFSEELMSKILKNCLKFKLSKSKVNLYAIQFCMRVEEKHEIQKIIAQDYSIDKIKQFVKQDVFY